MDNVANCFFTNHQSYYLIRTTPGAEDTEVERKETVRFYLATLFL